MATVFWAGECIHEPDGRIICFVNRDIVNGEEFLTDTFNWVGRRPLDGEYLRDTFGAAMQEGPYSRRLLVDGIWRSA